MKTKDYTYFLVNHRLHIEANSIKSAWEKAEEFLKEEHEEVKKAWVEINPEVKFTSSTEEVYNIEKITRKVIY